MDIEVRSADGKLQLVAEVKNRAGADTAWAAETHRNLTKNSKDFSNRDIDNDLAPYNCKLLTRFEDGVGYAGSRSAS